MTTSKTALYVHWPFCAQRCSYCDFRTFPYQEKRIPAYTEALQTELRLRGEQLGRPELSSLYFGGGTPSHIPTESLQAAMETIAAAFVVPKDIEQTIEMNPEEVSADRIVAYQSLGFNRVSLGIQTFDTRVAKDIGRGHTKEEGIRAVHALHDGGFANLSVDLMTGLPGQTMETLQRDFSVLAELPVSHLSVYSLTLAEHTHMHRRFLENPADFPDERKERRLAHEAARRAETLGFTRYEISNYAKPGKQSRHNLTYWKLNDYLGCGLSAASFLQGAHEKNTDSLAQYLERTAAHALPVSQREVLNPDELLAELLLTGLRLKEGISFAAITRRTGIVLEQEKAQQLSHWEKEGLLRVTKEGVVMTARGADLLDTVLVDLMRE